MNEPLLCWGFIFFIAVYRLLGKNRWFRGKLDAMDRWVFEHTNVLKYLQRQELEHDFEAGTFLFQWWFLAWLFLFIFLARAYYQISYYDYGKDHYLLDAPHDNFNFTQRLEDRFLHILSNQSEVHTFDDRNITSVELKEEVQFKYWMKSVSMAAPSVGILAFLFFSVHLARFAKAIKDENVRPKDDSDVLPVGTHVEVKGRRATVIAVDPRDAHLPYKVRFQPEGEVEPGPCADCVQWLEHVKGFFLPSDGAINSRSAKESWEKDWVGGADVKEFKLDKNPWVAAEHEDLALLVIMMPAAFTVMSTKALIRVLEVMSCSRCLVLDPSRTWSSYEGPLMDVFITDLELCATMQYFTVWAFAVLCTRHFNFAESLQKGYWKDQQDKAEQQNLRASVVQELEGKYVRLIRQKNDEYHRVLSIAGLLGLWAYLLVGLVRSGFGMLCAIFVHTMAPYKTLALDYVQPVFLFSMGLCIFNMFIVLKMEDLMKPDAFGRNANLKFNACRILLILGDMQKQMLTKLPISIYQAMLLHASLLIFECFAIIILNSYFWTRTKSMRTRYVREICLHKREQRVEEPSLLSQLLANKTAVLNGVLAPWLFLCVVLAFATMHRGFTDMPEAPNHTSLVLQVLNILNKVFSTVGPYVCFLVILPRWLVLRDLSFLQPGGHGSNFQWFPKGWVFGAFVLTILMILFRWIFFLFCHPYHDYISDHIVMAVVTIAIIQMEISLAYIAWQRTGSKPGLAVICWAWVVVLLIACNTWVTAKYYHTSLAVWVAFASSMLIFGVAVFWWLGLMLKPAGDVNPGGDDDLRRPLSGPPSSSSGYSMAPVATAGAYTTGYSTAPVATAGAYSMAPAAPAGAYSMAPAAAPAGAYSMAPVPAGTQSLMTDGTDYT